MDDTPARIPVVTFQVYVLAGGVDGAGKHKLIESATAILERRPNGTQVAPVCVVIHEVADQNWGIFGKHADVGALRASASDVPAI